MVPRKWQYIMTDEHRKHLSQALKEFWSVPENKERMSQCQIGKHRPVWSEDTNKKRSRSMKRYYRKHQQQNNDKISKGIKRYWKRRKKAAEEEQQLR